MDIMGHVPIVDPDITMEFDNEKGCNIWEDWGLKDNSMNSHRTESES